MSTGISFEDFTGSMHTFARTTGNSRQYETPSWVLDKKRFQEVFLEYAARYVSYRKLDRSKSANLRLREIAALWKARIPVKERILNETCARYVRAKRQGLDVRRLESHIERLDSTITMLRRGPSVVAAIIYSYYRRGMDSVATGAEHKVKPPAVRIMLWRLNNIAGERRVRKMRPRPLPKEPRAPKREMWECRKCGATFKWPWERKYCKACFKTPRKPGEPWTGKCERCNAIFEYKAARRLCLTCYPTYKRKARPWKARLGRRPVKVTEYTFPERLRLPPSRSSRRTRAYSYRRLPRTRRGALVSRVFGGNRAFELL